MLFLGGRTDGTVAGRCGGDHAIAGEVADGVLTGTRRRRDDRAGGPVEVRPARDRRDLQGDRGSARRRAENEKRITMRDGPGRITERDHETGSRENP